MRAAGFRLALAAPVLLLYAAALWWSPLNQDEGWYLYAARRVADGCRPYADFAFTQGPVMPWVYARFDPLVRAFGLAGGRAVTAFFGLLSVFLAVRLSMRLARGGPGRREAAGCAALLLCGWNVYQAMFTTVVKTYSLASVFWTAGILALVSIRNARAPVRHAAAAGAWLALAAATRSSAALAVPVTAAWLWHDRVRVTGRGFLAFAAAFAAVSMAVWLPAVLAAPEGVWFAMVEYHAGRAVGGWGQAVGFRAGFVSRLAGAWLPVLLCAAWPWVVRSRPASPRPAHGEGSAWVWAMLAAVSLAHLAAPFPYDDYQVFLFPVLAALAAAGLARGADVRTGGAGAAPGLEAAAPGRVWRGVALLVLLHTLGSPVWQEWAVAGRDRIWWRLRSRSPLSELRQTARELREAFPDARELLTQDLYLAVETGWRVPPGLELGPFSYYPDMDDARAARLRVLNRAGMERLLAESAAPVAAFSGYGLSVASPAVSELPAEHRAWLLGIVAERYEPWRRIPSFGQAGTDLDLYRLRDSGSAERTP